MYICSIDACCNLRYVSAMYNSAAYFTVSYERHVLHFYIKICIGFTLAYRAYSMYKPTVCSAHVLLLDWYQG